MTMMKNKITRWIPAAIVAALIPALLMFLILWIIPAAGHEGTERTARAMRGFTNIWFAGSMARSPDGVPYDFNAYNAALRSVFGENFPRHIWGYPPSMLLAAAPFSFLPIFASFLLWTLLGVFSLVCATGLTGREKHLPFGVIAAGILSPAVAENALSGQTGALAGSLLLGGLILCTTWPRLSGFMFGILAVKPQMGFLIPMHLIAARKWLVLLWGAAGLTVMFILSCMFFGMDSWIKFAAGTGKGMSEIMSMPWTGAPAQVNFTSPFMGFRALGISLGAAWLIQALITIGCAITCWKITRRVISITGNYPADGTELKFLCIAVVVCLDLLSVPYSHNYDMPAMAFAVALIVRNGILHNNILITEKIFLFIAWLWPGVMVLLPVFTPGIAPACPVIGAFSLFITAFTGIRRLKTEITRLHTEASEAHNSIQAGGRFYEK